MSADGLGLGDGSQDVIVLHDGSVMSTHGPSRCLGPHCCIHNPSDHPLRAAPMVWSGEISMMFRRCECDSLHPDPDSLDYNMMLNLMGRGAFYDGWHPCCPRLCCMKTE